MTVGDAPACQADLDGLHVGAIIAVAIRHKEEMWGGTEPQAAEADGDRRWKRNSFEEDLLAVSRTVSIGVLENEDPAFSTVGKTAATGFLVPIFCIPLPALGVKAECKRLADHRLGGEKIHFESRLHSHCLEGRCRREKWR